MKIACPKCGREYRLDPARIPAKGARFTCWGCQAKVEVRPLQGGEAQTTLADPKGDATKAQVAGAKGEPVASKVSTQISGRETIKENRSKEKTPQDQKRNENFITGPGFSTQALFSVTKAPDLNLPAPEPKPSKPEPLRITCPKCQHEYRIDPARVPTGGGKFTCKTCQARIEVRPAGKQNGATLPIQTTVSKTAPTPAAEVQKPVVDKTASESVSPGLESKPLAKETSFEGETTMVMGSPVEILQDTLAKSTLEVAPSEAKAAVPIFAEVAKEVKEETEDKEEAKLPLGTETLETTFSPNTETQEDNALSVTKTLASKFATPPKTSDLPIPASTASPSEIMNTPTLIVDTDNMFTPEEMSELAKAHARKVEADKTTEQREREALEPTDKLADKLVEEQASKDNVLELPHLDIPKPSQEENLLVTPAAFEAAKDEDVVKDPTGEVLESAETETETPALSDTTEFQNTLVMGSSPIIVPPSEGESVFFDTATPSSQPPTTAAEASTSVNSPVEKTEEKEPVEAKEEAKEEAKLEPQKEIKEDKQDDWKPSDPLAKRPIRKEFSPPTSKMNFELSSLDKPLDRVERKGKAADSPKPVVTTKMDAGSFKDLFEPPKAPDLPPQPPVSLAKPELKDKEEKAKTSLASAKLEPPKLEIPKLEPPKPEVAKPELAKVELQKPEPVKPDLSDISKVEVNTPAAKTDAFGRPVIEDSNLQPQIVYHEASGLDSKGRPKKSRAAVAIWGLVIGSICAASAIAAYLYFSDNKPPKGSQQIASSAPKPTPKVDKKVDNKESQAAQTPTNPKETKNPEEAKSPEETKNPDKVDTGKKEEKQQANGKDDKVAKANTKASEPTEKEPTRPRTVTQNPIQKQPEITTPLPGKYTVQAGASPSEAEAKSLSNRLKSLGIDSYVIRADLGNKGIWYRVRTGGFQTQEEARKVLEKLNQKGFEGFIARQ
ncbi:MAG: zinc-ribbon domain-containing protein [Blastocatellia bacterium]|nr:zinc-ribbon domain-containing protein [Blastocatellia bacterium]